MTLEGPIDRYRRQREQQSVSNWQDIIRSLSSVKPASVPGPLSGLGSGIESELAQQEKQNIFGRALGVAGDVGKTALQTIGGTLDVGRELVVGTGVGLWNSGIAPVLGAVTGEGADAWQNDVDGDGNNDDTLFNQWAKALNPNESVVGMGTLIPGLNVESDDSVLMRGAKLTGALAGDLLTDPTIFLGGATKAISGTQRVTLAGTNVAEEASKLIGKEISQESAERLARKNLSRVVDESTELTQERLRQQAVQLLDESDLSSIINITDVDQAAAAIVKRLSPEQVAGLAAKELGDGSMAAMRQGRAVGGLLPYLRRELGDEVGTSLFGRLDDRVVNRLEVRVPFTKLQAVQRTEAGSILSRIPGMEELVRFETRLSNKVRAPLTLGRQRPALMAARRAAGNNADESTRIFFEQALEARRLGLIARQGAEGQTDKAIRTFATDLLASKKRFAGELDRFNERRAYYYHNLRRLEAEGDELDAIVPDSVEAAAYRAAKIQQQQLEIATYKELRDQYARDGGRSRIAQETADAVDNEFSKFGVVEDARRVLTKEGRDRIEATMGRASRASGLGRAGGGARSDAFSILDDEGNIADWLTVPEINELVGFKMFETDPDKILSEVHGRIRRAAGDAAERRALIDAGVVTVVPRADFDYREPVANTVTKVLQRVERGAERARARAENIRTGAGAQPTARQAERIADDVTDERLAQLEAARQKVRDDIAAAQAGGRATRQQLAEQEKQLNEQLRELNAMRTQTNREAQRDVARQRAEARQARASARAEVAAARSERSQLRKSAKAEIDAAKARVRELKGDKDAQAVARDELKALERTRDEAVAEANGRVQALDDKLGLALAREEALSAAKPATVLLRQLDDIDTQISDIQDELAELGADRGAKKAATESVLDGLRADRAKIDEALSEANRTRRQADTARRGAERRKTRAETKAQSVEEGMNRLVRDSEQLTKVLEQVATMSPEEQARRFESLLGGVVKVADSEVTSLEKRLAVAVAELERRLERELGTKTIQQEVERATRMLEQARNDAFDVRALDLSPEIAGNRIRQAAGDGDIRRLGTVQRNNQTIDVSAVVRDTMVPNIAAQAFTQAYRVTKRSQKLPENLTQFMRALNSSWKQQATVGRGPSFWLRNGYGGSYNAWLGGARASDTKFAVRYYREYNKALDDAVEEISKGTVPVEQINTFLDDFMKERLSKVAHPNGGTLWEHHVEIERRNLMGTFLEQVTDGDLRENIAAINVKQRPIKLQGNLDVDEMGSAERTAYRALNGLANNRWFRWNATMQENTEFLLRSTTYFAGIRQAGFSETGKLYADLLVKATQFDYSDLSRFESGVLRYIFPFFTFTKNNVPLQMRSLIQSPGKVNALLRTNYYAAQMFGGDSELAQVANDNRPEWLRGTESWASGISQNGAPVMFGIGAPLIDINRFGQAVGDTEMSLGSIGTLPFRAAASFGGEAIEQVNPAIKFGIEAATGTNLFTNNQFRDTGGNPIERLLLGSGAIDPETGEELVSGFAQRQLQNFLPLYGTAQRVLPYGPLDSQRYQDRVRTSWASTVGGLSGLPVGPQATATEDQIEAWIGASNRVNANAVRNAATEAGLDWGSISRAKETRSWQAIANGIEQGRYLAPYAQNEMATTGSLPPDMIAKQLAVIEALRLSEE